MWGHYASGFKGVAIEVALPDSDRIRRINYCAHIPRVENRDNDCIEYYAQRILFTKYMDWSYENEIRVQSNQTHYELTNPIARVIVGHRIKTSDLKKLKSLRRSKQFFLSCARLTDDGLRIDRIP